MSGIAGIVHLGGAPGSVEPMEGMLDALAIHGPDRRSSCVQGAAVLGATLLVTGREQREDAGPRTLDGSSWIVADARIDARSELLRDLRGSGRSVAEDCSDSELILQAFHAWDRACVNHLHGDFSFAIWQPAQRRLFCARDHFGIRSFYFARLGERLIFSNSLAAVERAGGVLELDERWIADFLMFGESLEEGATVWKAVRRLPAAHALESTPGGIEVLPYWRLPEDLAVSAGKDCVDTFSALLERAVADRLSVEGTTIEMSGGLDSTSVAGVACAVMRRRGVGQASAYTMVSSSLTPDPEGPLATAVAARLRIPLAKFDSDSTLLYERFDELAALHPEPLHDPMHAFRVGMLSQVAKGPRVVLTGWDGDSWLNDSPKPYLRQLAREGRWLQAVRGLAAYALMERRVMPRGLLGQLRPAPPNPRPETAPPWLSASLAEAQARARLARLRHIEERAAHPRRPNAYRAWEYLQRTSSHFEWYEPALTQQPLEYRHPLMDRRLVEFLVGLPPLPWCVRKHILKLAMRDTLPPQVLQRPKSPVPPQWLAGLLARDSERIWREFVPARGLERFVDVHALRLNWAGGTASSQWRDLRAVTLNYWLRSRPALNG